MPYSRRFVSVVLLYASSVGISHIVAGVAFQAAKNFDFSLYFGQNNLLLASPIKGIHQYGL